MATLTQVNRQLANRPDDQKFHGAAPLRTMLRHYLDLDKVSQSAIYGTDQIRFSVESGSGAVVMIGPSTTPEIDINTIPGQRILTVPEGSGAIPTNWAWGQACVLAGAPAAYIGTLARTAPGLAVAALNQGLDDRGEHESVAVLARRPGGRTEVHALTGPKYGRILNSTILQAANDQFGDGATGEWRIPGIFGKKVDKITPENTTFFGSDRDIFICLANEEKKIVVKGRRDGKDGEMSRFLWIGNSEVGSGKLSIGFGYFDYFCSNRMIWGAEDFQEFSIRHTSGAPERYLAEAAPAIKRFMESSTRDLTARIAAAQAKKLDAPPAEFLRRWFSAPVTKKIEAAHMTEENRPIETLWDCNTGITAYAKTIPWQSERLAVEKLGGKVLSLAV